MTTTAAAPSESCDELPAVIARVSRLGHGALERGQPVEGRVGAIALVFRRARRALRVPCRSLYSATYFHVGKRHDLGVESPRRLRGGGALLALQRVLVLRSRVTL